MSEKKASLVLSHLRSQMEVSGFGAAKVDDGELFLFSRATVENMLKQIDEKGSDSALIFVKNGPILREG